MALSDAVVLVKILPTKGMGFLFEFQVNATAGTVSKTVATPQKGSKQPVKTHTATTCFYGSLSQSTCSLHIL
jgi:hypothetical protein